MKSSVYALLALASLLLVGRAAWAEEHGEEYAYYDISPFFLNRKLLTGGSGAQAGSLIQTIAPDGSVHKHFVVSPFGAAGASNVPEPSGLAILALAVPLLHRRRA